MAKTRAPKRRVAEADLDKLRNAVDKFNRAEKARHSAAVLLEACKIELQQKYHVDDGEQINLTTGEIFR